MRNLAVSLAVLCLLTAGGASAQISTGSMSGTVLDTSNQVVPGADVTIVHESSGAQRQTVTNEVGRFRICRPRSRALHGPGGALRLQTPRSSKQRRRRQRPSRRRRAAPRARSTHGDHHVTAIGETLDLTRTSHEAQLDLRQVTNLSIRGRDPISLLKILPGRPSAGNNNLANDQETFGGSFATAVPVIGGSRGAQQTIYVDGINGGDGGGGGGGGDQLQRRDQP